MSFRYCCEIQIRICISAEPLYCLKPSWNKQDINTASHCAKPAGTGIITPLILQRAEEGQVSQVSIANWEHKSGIQTSETSTTDAEPSSYFYYFL